MRRYGILYIIILMIVLFKVDMVLAAPVESGFIDGYNKGYTDGKVEAIKNNNNNSFLTYEQVKPTDHKVITSNSTALNNKDSDYITNFVSGYQEGFLVGYNEIIIIKDVPVDSITNSTSFGDLFGTIYGEIAGLQDSEKKITPSWSRAILKDSVLISKFDLSRLPYTERQCFLKNYRSKFKLAYEHSYYEAHFGTNRDSAESGTADGILFGTSLGNIYGALDYFENRNSDYTRNMPLDRSITLDSSLNRDNTQYVEGFLSGFKKAYKESYISSFRDSKNQTIILEESMANENGKSVGYARGEVQASVDYMEKKTSDWKRTKPLSATLILDYNLSLQTLKYRENYLAGFWNGYMYGYTDAYKEISQNEALNKETSATIPTSGGALLSLDNGFEVIIDKGTYYKQVILSLDTLNSNNYSFDKKYILASNLYKVSVVNPSGDLNNNIKIKLSFEYYGDKSAGIYKLENGKWQYMSSVIDESSISTLINPSNLKSNGNIYTVLLNNEAPVFHDIRGHWAKDEINTLIRRNIIYGYNDQTFKPENKITRAEFLTLLSRVYNWNLSSHATNTTHFKDYASFGNRDKVISYAISAGYIKGYEDNTFRPNDTISYKEVEIIMGRAVDKSFKWYNSESKMLYEKKVRASSYDNVNNKINRGEVSYMLYILNEWKY